MSRHSKWSKIKHQKGVEDAKRGILFTKLARAITLAAREGGSDPKMNFKLRLAIDQARAFNLPKDNVLRAIDKGIGALDEGETIEQVYYEGFLPDGAVIIIESLTDNKNRTSSVIKHLLSKYGGNLGGPNSVARFFERKGVVRISNYKNLIANLDDFELKAIDLGAEDIFSEEEDLVIYTKPENLEVMKKSLEKENINPDYMEIEFVAKEKIMVNDPAAREKIENLLNELDDNEEINNYYTNLSGF